MATSTENRSNEILTSQEIETLICLYEDPDQWAEHFLSNVARETLPDAKKTVIRKNFPYADYYRRTIKRLAMSIPSFTWELSKEAKEKFVKKVRDDAGDEQGDDLPEKPTVLDKANEISSRRIWEGNKDIWGALNSWREFLFVTGDLFITLTKPQETGEFSAERMGSQDSQIKLSEKYRKKVEGYKFEYEVGSDLYTESGTPGATVTQEYTKDAWKISGFGVEDAEIPLAHGFIPVAHLAWEEREGSPRGLPLSERLAKITLWIYAASLGRRDANKLNATPVAVLRNSTSNHGDYFPGMTLEIHDKSPTAPASLEFKGGNIQLTSTENEIEDGKRALSEAAFLPYEGKEGAQGVELASGVALEKLTAAQTAYRIQYMLAEAGFLEDLIYKSLVIDGTPVERGDIVVKYDGFGEDQKNMMEKAKVLFAEGLPKEALRVLGYEDEVIEKILSEKEEKTLDDFGGIFGGNGQMMPAPAENQEQNPVEEEEEKEGENAEE